MTALTGPCSKAYKWKDRLSAAFRLVEVVEVPVGRRKLEVRSLPGIPLRQRHQLQAEAAVVDTEIIIQAAAHDGIGMDQGNFLRHHADIDRVAPQIAVFVQAEAVVEARHQNDVTLEPGIGRGGRRINSTRAVAPRAATMATEI